MFIPPNLTAAAALLYAATSHTTSTISTPAYSEVNRQQAPSQDGTCGPFTADSTPSSRNQTCTGSTFGPSCSRYGRCGSGFEFAGPGCRPEFGTCGVNYTTFTGNGELNDGWPAKSSWIDFDDMWHLNQRLLTEGCDEGVTANKAEETENLRLSILATSTGAQVIDARFILAIILEESAGCLRINTPPGLNWTGVMQSYLGASCQGQDTCSNQTIVDMVRNGSIGTNFRTLQGALELTGLHDLQYAPKYYKTARIYDSVFLFNNNTLENIGTTGTEWPCYASDIANRLLGWIGKNSTGICDLQAAHSATRQSSSYESQTASSYGPFASTSIGTFTYGTDSGPSSPSLESTHTVTVISFTTQWPTMDSSATTDSQSSSLSSIILSSGEVASGVASGTPSQSTSTIIITPTAGTSSTTSTSLVGYDPA